MSDWEHFFRRVKKRHLDSSHKVTVADLEAYYRRQETEKETEQKEDEDDATTTTPLRSEGD